MTRSSQFVSSLFFEEKPLAASAFKGIRESLFLEADDSYSRVEAYATHLLHAEISSRPPSQLILTATTNGGRGGERETSKTISSLGEPGNISEDFYVTEIETLRSPEDIVRYCGSTHGFRAFFIRQRFSYSSLSITLKLFESLLSVQSITPQIKDYVLNFGQREREVEIAPPLLRYRPFRYTGNGSGVHGYECTYGFRFFESNGRGSPEEPTSQWSLRQTAVYCRYAPSSDGTTWLITTISPIAQRRLNSYVTCNAELQNADPFEIHLLLLDTAIANWRMYLIDLAAEVDHEGAEIAGTSPSDEGPTRLSDDNRRQHLISLDEQIISAILVARATIDTVKTLYKSRKSQKTTEGESDDAIQLVLLELLRDLDLVLARLDTLKAKLKSSTTLLSSFLDLSSGFALQNLTLESRKENEEMRKLSERMHKLTEKATQDAAAVKVLTILTLIYLPATVVSNFFSTSFVGTESKPGTSDKIVVLGDWWIFVAVSVPLTLITLYVWWVWMRIKAYQKYPWWLFYLRPDRSTVFCDLEGCREKQ